jgi:hypothetical protein
MRCSGAVRVYHQLLSCHGCRSESKNRDEPINFIVRVMRSCSLLSFIQLFIRLKFLFLLSYDTSNQTNYSESYFSNLGLWISRVNAIPIDMPNTKISQKPASLGLLAILE